MKPFQSNPQHYNNNAALQAQAIWDREVQPLLNQGKNVGLLYAANDNQARALHKANNSNASAAGIISGGGQALLFAELAKLIDKKKMTSQVHILPIATSLTGGNNTPGNQVSKTELDRDLNAVEKHNNNGWEIRGLGTVKGHYHIGGGNSVGFYDANNASIGGLSQGDYVQQRLAAIARNSPAPAAATPSAAAPPKSVVNTVIGAVSSSVNSLAETGRKETDDSKDMAKFNQGVGTQIAAGALRGVVGGVRAGTNYIAKRKVPSSPKNSTIKIQTMLSDSQPAPQKTTSLLKKFSPASTMVTPGSFAAIEKNMKNGQVPNALLQSVHSKHERTKNQAATLLTEYAVKGIIGNLNTTVTIDKVPNTRSHLDGHDKQAMKVNFSTHEEAAAFADQLFEVHGIHSLTQGSDSAKTPQGNPATSIFLTADDLEKITLITSISNEAGLGKLVYQSVANNRQQQNEDTIPLPDNEKTFQAKPR